MVLLITGASHTGKTVLARRLVERYGYACLSLDLLKMGLIRSGNTSLTPEDDDALTDYLWPIAREMVKTAIENRQDLIVEGCYIPGNWRQGFSAEYLAQIRRVMEEGEVAFQFAELGKVDEGGGGTIAYIMANYGMEVIDSGVAVLSMHAPWEVTSKADVYEAYKGYKAFLQIR